MLVAIDGEQANSVGDTPESGMCVNIANRAFEELATFRKWRHFRSYIELEATTALNELVMPSGTIAFNPDALWYNDKLVRYMDPDEFLEFTIKRNTSESNIQEINNIKVYNDRDPQFYTTDDDETLIFDAMPDALSGLVAGDSRGLAYRLIASRLTDDDDVFDLPIVMFPALDMLCISMAIGELKGDTQESSKKERKYIKMVGSLARNARLVDKLDDRRKWLVPRVSSTRSLRPLLPTS